FPDSGVAAYEIGDLHVLVKAGPFGSGSGGHSHSDTLSIVARLGDEEILTDPGTFTYVADRRWRDWFRGSAAHNTVRVNGRDQAIPAGPFRWQNKPVVRVLENADSGEMGYLDAVCEYGGIRHRRRVLVLGPERLLVVLDSIIGGEGQHDIEWFWHLGAPAERVGDHCFRIGRLATLAVPSTERLVYEVDGVHGWRSPVLGLREAAPVVRIAQRRRLPVTKVTAIGFGGDARSVNLHSVQEKWSVGLPAVQAVFAEMGRPEVKRR
ncbi:MAG: hypothetical protein GY953_34730, partial [bacterium]|nr:hypothetical protein [bacterium]